MLRAVKQNGFNKPEEKGLVTCKKILWTLTNIHDGGGHHVAHGRREEEEGVEALATIYPGFWSTFVVAN